MAREDLGQAVGEVARQALARPLGEPQFEVQPVVAAARVAELDIVAAFLRVAEERLEELLGPLCGKERREFLLREDVLILTHRLFPPV